MTTQMTLTEAQAKRRGYALTRGSYSGTTDNRLDRWYVEHIDSNTVNRTGEGYATKREALEALATSLEYLDWENER